MKGSQGCPLLLVTGTGTGIGKTVVAAGLTAAWAATGRAIAGLKPVESGVMPAASPEARAIAEDVTRLGQVSTFHVTRFTPPYLLADPVSPHLAARREGREILLAEIVAWLAPIRRAADGIVLELPGGLFSPLSTTLTNADLLAAIAPTKTLLVAPDRLGVLHDALATLLAAEARGIRFDAVLLSAPQLPDASTGTNAAELSLLRPELPVLGVLPRGGADDHWPLLQAALGHLLPSGQ